MTVYNHFPGGARREPGPRRYDHLAGRRLVEAVVEDLTGSTARRYATLRFLTACLGLQLRTVLVVVGLFAGLSTPTAAVLIAVGVPAAGFGLATLADRRSALESYRRGEVVPVGEKDALEAAWPLLRHGCAERTDLLVALSAHTLSRRIRDHVSRMVSFGEISSLEFDALARRRAGALDEIGVRRTLERLATPVGRAVSKPMGRSNHRDWDQGTDSDDLDVALALIGRIEVLGEDGRSVLAAAEALPASSGWLLGRNDVVAVTKTAESLCSVEGAVEVFCGLAADWSGTLAEAADAALAVAASRS